MEGGEVPVQVKKPGRRKHDQFNDEFRELNLVRQLTHDDRRVKYLERLCGSKRDAWRAQGTLKGKPPTCRHGPNSVTAWHGGILTGLRCLSAVMQRW